MTTLSPYDIQTRLPGTLEPGLVASPVETELDILGRYRGTPIGDLLASHNLGRLLPVTPTAELLIVTCMDHRVTLDVPEFFAYQIRTAGATPMPVFSNVAYAVAVAGVRSICVITNTDCAMSRTDETGAAMAEHLVAREGWNASEARDQRVLLQKVFRVEDPVEAAWSHARDLRCHFPSCLVAPLLYRVEDGALLQIERSRTSAS